jgi:hypothetical protein
MTRCLLHDSQIVIDGGNAKTKNFTSLFLGHKNSHALEWLLESLSHAESSFLVLTMMMVV